MWGWLLYTLMAFVGITAGVLSRPIITWFMHFDLYISNVSTKMCIEIECMKYEVWWVWLT